MMIIEDLIEATKRILSAGGWDWQAGKPEWVELSAEELGSQIKIMRLKAEAYDRAQDRMEELRERIASTAALQAEIIALTTYRENLREEVRERIADQAALQKRVEELEAALRDVMDHGDLAAVRIAKAALGGQHD